jgi:hypothetical protein
MPSQTELCATVEQIAILLRCVGDQLHLMIDRISFLGIREWFYERILLVVAAVEPKECG